MQTETLTWNVAAQVEKYSPQTLAAHGITGDVTPEQLAAIEADEVVDAKGNLLLNEGIGRLLNLLVGAGGTPYNNANARIGVGNGTTAVSAAQTGLTGASSLFKGMDSGFPSVSGQTVTFKTTYQDAEANFAWQEWSVDNGPGVNANENLNRKVISLGTKVGGVWSLTVSITVS